MPAGIRAVPDPARPAVIAAESGASLSHRALAVNAARLASSLRDRGLSAGDVVAVLAVADPHCFEAYWAALRSGMAIAPIDCSLSLEETAYLVNDSGARALVASAEVAGLATELSPLTPGVDTRLAFGGAVDQHEEYESVLARASGDGCTARCGRELFYTAGVTGRPRAARSATADGMPDEHTRRLRVLLSQRCGVGPDTVLCSALPFSDALGTQVAASVHDAGGTVVTMTRRSPETVLAAVERYRVTMLQLAPELLVRLVKLPRRVRASYDLSSLRAVIHSGAPCPTEAKQRAIDWLGPVVHEFYSSAERAGMTFINATQWCSRRGSVGTSVLGALRVCDETGAELPRGEVGMVYFERDSPPFWYHNAPEMTRAAQHPFRPNWTTMGDLGSVDDDGYLFLADRASFVIDQGERPVYPREVEDLLVMHPLVADAAVIGVPDASDGWQVTAVVQLARDVAPGHELARELIGFVRASVSRHTVPRAVEFVDRVPRTASGKLTKSALLRKYALADRATP